MTPTTKATVVAMATVTTAVEPVIPWPVRILLSGVGLVVIGWLWRTFIRQAIDNAGLDGARRNSAGWRSFLRDEIFDGEIAEQKRRGEQVQDALRIAAEAHAIASANAGILDTIVGGIDTLRREQNDFRREVRRSLRDAMSGKYSHRSDDTDSATGDDAPLSTGHEPVG